MQRLFWFGSLLMGLAGGVMAATATDDAAVSRSDDAALQAEFLAQCNLWASGNGLQGDQLNRYIQSCTENLAYVRPVGYDERDDGGE